MINKFSAFCSKASVLKKKIWQNGVKRFSAFCQNAIFGNMSVHHMNFPVFPRFAIYAMGWFK